MALYFSGQDKTGREILPIHPILRRLSIFAFLRRRLLLISLLVGIIGGIGAITLFLGLEYGAHYGQGVLMGLHPPRPTGEIMTTIPESTTHPLRPWLVLLLPALGGLCSGFLVYKFAPEAEGHGMDATINTFHRHKGKVRLRVPFVKGLASILTIGSGGSGGREGPIAQIGGGIGAWLADKCHLSDHERRIFMLAGTAAGIGAIFRAPLGGAITATEILYKEDFESSALIPCVISSVTSYTLFRLFLASHFIGITAPRIYSFPHLNLQHSYYLLYYALLAIVCAMMGKLYVAVFHGVRQRLFARMPLPRMLRPMLGGLMVGAIGLLSVKALGGGHGYLQQAIDTSLADQNPQQILLLMRGFFVLALLKILATSLTIGSGGSAGVFGPSLLIGGLTGAGMRCAFALLLPHLNLPPMSAFVVLGMAGFFAGVANAPIGAVIMVSEMTGSYELLAPLLLVCVINVLLNRKWSLYESQVENRFASPAHQNLMVKDILAEVSLQNYYHPAAMATINHRTRASELRRYLANSEILFPLTIVDDHNHPCGILNMGDIRTIFFTSTDESFFLVTDLAAPLVTCSPRETLASVSHKFEKFGYGRIPVVAENNDAELIGFVQYQDVMAAYEKELTRRKLTT
jgi:CIC family chloride channel protein